MINTQKIPNLTQKTNGTRYARTWYRLSWCVLLIYVTQLALLPAARADVLFSGDNTASPVKSTAPPVQDNELFRTPLAIGNQQLVRDGNLYIFTDRTDEKFLEIYESLPAGGFGRLLRYRGILKTRWIDMEYRYDDAARSITILDYGESRYFRILLHENRKENSGLFPLNDIKDLKEVLWAINAQGFKTVLLKNASWIHFSEHQKNLKSAVLASKDPQHRNGDIERGPPAEENRS